jgi:hypothetical protein
MLIALTRACSSELKARRVPDAEAALVAAVLGGGHEFRCERGRHRIADELVQQVDTDS